MAPKADSGKPCKREAGSGTDHWGEGPCALHDDGTWTGVTFADDEQAQEDFLEAVRVETEALKATPIRELIEPLGYRKRDVTRLISQDPSFADLYIEARGYDPDTIRNELHRRALAGGSDTLLKLVVEMTLPEAAVLRQRRMDGTLDVRATPYLDASKLSSEEQDLLRRLLEKASPTAEDLPRDGRPALELVAGEGTT